MRNAGLMNVLSLALVLCSCAGGQAAGGHSGPAALDPAAPAQILQTLEIFHRPESGTPSLDGRSFFVANCGSSPRGLVAGDGAISKLTVNADGSLTPVNLNFVTGLNGPLGITVLPRATGRFPAGTIFVNVGMAWAVDQEGNPITDPKTLGTGVMAIDPSSGQQLAHLYMGPGTPAAEALGHPVVAPNGATFDAQGNLYIADGGGGGNLVPPVAGRSGIIRISPVALDALADGQSSDGIAFLPVERTNGVGYDARNDRVLFTGPGGTGQEAGGIYAVPARTFATEVPPPLAVGLGGLDGIVVTRNGTILASRPRDGAILWLDRDYNPVTLPLQPAVQLVSPSDIKLLYRRDGRPVLAVPEQQLDAPQPWSQRVRMLLLPASM